MSTITENAADALTNARTALSALERARVDTDADYRTAPDSGDVTGMKTARERKADLDDEIIRAKIVLVRAEAAEEETAIRDAQRILDRCDAEIDVVKAKAAYHQNLLEAANAEFSKIVMERQFAENAAFVSKQRLAAAQQRLNTLTSG